MSKNIPVVHPFNKNSGVS